jgi:hypothetical protein
MRNGGEEDVESLTLESHRERTSHPGADEQRRPWAVHGRRRSLVVLDAVPAGERRSKTDLGWSPTAREKREWIRTALGTGQLVQFFFSRERSLLGGGRAL